MFAQTTPRAIQVSYDEADIDEVSLQAARRIALGALVKRGVQDLNALTPADLDAMFAIFKLAYENVRASREHQFGSFAWAAHFKGLTVESVP
jgi:hypothetical protein